MFSVFTRGTDHSRNRQLKAPFRQISSDFEPVLEPDAAAWYNTGSGRMVARWTQRTKRRGRLRPQRKSAGLSTTGRWPPLKTFHEHGVITQAQHDKSLHDLTEKMGYEDKH